jgi:hypothetical protein
MSLTKATYSMINGAPVNVLDFGADPTGVADSTTAINNALLASDAIYFPAGTYLTNGSHNILNKAVYGVPSKLGDSLSIIKLSGTNTNSSLFINGGSIATGWGSGGGCLIRDLQLLGNWDGTSPNAQTDISLIGGLVKWWAGAYVKIQDCYITGSFGFGIFSYQLGYSTIENCFVSTNAKNGIHLEAPSGANAITSTTINNTSVNSCRGAAPTGGNGIYINNGFYCDVNGCVIEDVLCGIYIDGNDNRSITIFETHLETTTNAGVFYDGAGTDLMLFQNIFATLPAFVQTDPQFQRYSAQGNFNLVDLWPLVTIRSAGTRVNLNNATPSTTINSITLPEGTWVISAAWNGVTSSGTGQLGSKQAFAINTSAAIPTYVDNFQFAICSGDSVSTVNTSDGLIQNSLTLTITVATTTTFYLYGGANSVTSTLNVALSGWMCATRINDAYAI